MASNAIPDSTISAVLGYALERGFEGLGSSNLPQRIAIVAEVPDGAPLDPFSFLSSNDVGGRFGYGTPAHIAARILRSQFGDNLGSIPTIVYPVANVGDPAERQVVINTAPNGSGTFNVYINGRNNVDGASYAVSYAAIDTPDDIAQKMSQAITSVLGAPCISDYTDETVSLVSKWTGSSSEELIIEVDPEGVADGLEVSYIASGTGSGIPDISPALNAIGDEWATMVVNCTGNDGGMIGIYTQWAGNPNNRTGRYVPSVFKPAIVFTGSTAGDLAACIELTMNTEDEAAIAFCPAPNSKGFTFEAAANVVAMYAPIVQSEPHRDIINVNYPDMPTPIDGNAGIFTFPSGRDQVLKVGHGTCELVSGRYRMVDMATTYRPTNEPQTAVSYRFVRDMIGVDWNVFYNYRIQEELYVEGKTIINDGQATSVRNTISPNSWKGIVNNLSDTLTDIAITADPEFMKQSIEVRIGTSNPSRFETFFRYKRTGIARVVSTNAETNPNFGTLNT